MTDHDEGFRSVTGLSETADPAPAAEDCRPSKSKPGATSATTNPITPAHHTATVKQPHPLNHSAPLSATNSPMSSRDTSPSRPPHPHRQSSAMAAPARRVQRSRKNSNNNDVSPNRPTNLQSQTSTAPSAAAIQRALASANAPQLQPPPQPDSTRGPRPHKSNGSGDNTPHWPLSPRIKSPPPPTNNRSRRNSLRSQQAQQAQPAQQSRAPRPDLPQSTQSAPNIVVERTASPPDTRKPKNDPSPSDSEDQDGSMARKGSMRAPSGAAPALETVQEASFPATPGFNILQAHSNNPAKSSSDDTVVANSTESVKENSKARESGSESGGNNNKSEEYSRRAEQKKASGVRPSATSRNSFTGLVPGKSRSVTEPSRNMTVETETVRSVPQGVIGPLSGGPSLGRGEPSGSLRLKPSNETIRPKRDRRKALRKAPSITSGTGRYPPIVRNPFSHHHVPVVNPTVSPVVRPDFPVRSHTVSALSTTADSSTRSLAYPSSGDYSQFTQTPSTIVSKHMSSTYTNDSPRKASSKADIFEARVASAVDEANSSDSDETFVYESNPPDTQPRATRHHSRTPSATSMASMVDHPARLAGGLRTINNVFEGGGHRSIAGKRSMKFANSPYGNPSLDEDVNERFDGAARGNPSRSGSSHYHHIGRFGRNAAVNSLFEDGPVPPGSKSRSVSGYRSQHGSAPSSPKFPHYAARTSNPSGRKMGELSAYDMDGEGADDERTPLMSTVRSRRGPPARPRPTSASLHYHDRYERRRRGCLRRFAGCFVLTIMVLLLAFGAVGFLFATTKPLYKVQIVEIQNVLASEQEIMLDLLVEAINPNIVAVTIADMDVNVFAKSKHVGSERYWDDEPESGFLGPVIEDRFATRRRKRRHSDASFHSLDDDPHDPAEDPEGDSQTMLLGRIFHFDSPLNFDGDPLKRRPHYSVGEVRLQKPGNKTEAGGTERWERVIQYPFELIVRGILRYQLPLSSSTHTAPIGASVVVHPEKGVNSEGAMWIEQVWREHVYDSLEEIE